jgi:hypothetical protein
LNNAFTSLCCFFKSSVAFMANLHVDEIDPRSSGKIAAAEPRDQATATSGTDGRTAANCET